jgi:hypothetical protein
MGMNFFPLWTAMVKPTSSGMIVERRDQVLITFSPIPSLALWTFLKRLASI